MKKIFMATAAVTLMTMLVLTSCTNDKGDNPVIVVTDDKPFDYEQDMDQQVHPGDDFYRYVLGAWLDSDNPSPSMWTQTQTILNSVLEKAVLESADPLMATIRQQAEQSLTDDSKSVALLKQRLAMLEAVETADQFYAAFAKLHELGYNPLFSVKNAADAGRKVIGVFTTGGMGKTMQTAMSSKQLSNIELFVPRYCGYLASVGYSEERIRQITANAIRIETMEQEAFATGLVLLKQPDLVLNTSNRRAPSAMQEKVLRQLYSLMGMDYDEMQGRVEIDYRGLDYLLSLFSSVSQSSETISVLRDYMIYKIIEMDGYLMPTIVPQTSTTAMGIVAIDPIRYYTYQIMTETFGREIIHRDECRAIMEQVRQLFIERLQQLEWMSSSTKTAARQKAEAMQFYIGYPDKWNEAMSPQVDGTCLLETATQIRQYGNKITLQLAGKSLDEAGWEFWLSFASFNTDNATYSRGTNSLLILPSWIMAPRFDNSLNEATLYAAAITFGHEFCHAFDAGGAEHDAYGAERDWWTPGDNAAFLAKQQELITLFNQLEAYPGQAANGEKTLEENMADYGGVTLVLELYKRHLRQQGFQREQMDIQIRKFFIAYARLWQTETERSLSLLQDQYLHDAHSAAHTRINGMMRLQDDWYRLYDVKPTHKLYLAPNDRVKIW